MRRSIIYGLVLVILLIVAGLAAYYFNQFWIHRYDDLIETQAKVYRLEQKLVWSVIYEETYFRAWQVGADKEVGLMQVTPVVAMEWAKETGLKELERQTAEDVGKLLREPERNIQIGCWYLEKSIEKYRDSPAKKAMMLAAYNAGASRVEQWTKGLDISKLSEKDFIASIDISSTKSYVSSILKRYREAD
jgi:soluble lytic murein transglycosylase